MTRDNIGERVRVFISHASDDLRTARQVEAALEAAGFDPWLDHSDIRVGALLRKELQQAIDASQAVVLLWSKAAAASRWVAAEILTAFHLNRFIVPCVLSATKLPQFLSRSVYLDLRKRRAEVLGRLGAQLKCAPRAHNEFPAVQSYRPQQLDEAVSSIDEQQRTILDRLDHDDLSEARKLHAKLDAEMRAAERRWRYDPTILNLAGYHRKNAYMLKHWEEYCAGRFPQDQLLEKGERLFFETLFVNPIDHSALNGLGNILLFEGELGAAEFFVEKAIQCAANAGVDYQEAKHDLELIRNRIQAPEPGTVPGGERREPAGAERSGVNAGGSARADTAASVKEIFQQMPSSFNAEAAKEMDAVVQFNLTGEGGGTYHIAIKDGACTVSEGAHASPNMTMTMAAQDYVDMISGKLNGQMAFTSGKLKIAGDLGLAMKMQSRFKRPDAGGPEQPEATRSREPAQPEFDEVYLAVSAAPSVTRGQQFAARFAAYVKALEEKVQRKLTELDRGRTRVETGLPSNTRWQRGAPVTVRVSGDHLTAAPPEQSFDWSGTENLLGFLVTVAADAPLGEAYLIFDVCIAGFTVALIQFLLNVTEKTMAAGQRTDVRTPAHTAFASYSAADQVRVLDKLGAVCAYDKSLDVFTDCLDLKPGDQWQHELETVIPARDLFFLFWSQNAMKSRWVDWEWRQALAAKGLLGIQPIPLDPPQLAPPPKELEPLHFADKYTLAREGALRIEERRVREHPADP